MVFVSLNLSCVYKCWEKRKFLDRFTYTHTTQNQYIFVHDAILESVTCGDTQIETFSLRVAMRKLRERSLQGETGFQQQFSVSYHAHTQSRFTIDCMFTTAHVSYVSKLSPCELLCVCLCMCMCRSLRN